jgi:RHS repeat-associated protein
VTDRLGSVVKRDSERLRYFPWGEEQSTTTQNRDKFGTYYRDSTGLDYAQNRYYSSQHGRFLTADPYVAPRALRKPQAWNRYAYVENDPVNFYDPYGLQVMEVGDPPPPDPTPSGGTRGSGDPGGSDGMEVVADLLDGGGSTSGTVEPPPVVGRSGLKYYGLSSEGPKYEVVKARIDEMNSRLKDDPDCLEWLRSGTNGGYADPSLLAVLAEMTRVAGRIEKDGSNASGIKAIALDVPGVAIIVNGQGAFFYGGTGPTTNDQILILLHELAHVTGAPGFAPNDSASDAQAANAALLKEKCAKAISP